MKNNPQIGTLKDTPNAAEVFPVQTIQRPDAQLLEFRNPFPDGKVPYDGSEGDEGP